MPSDLQIRQLKLSDQPALFSFFRVAYPGEPLKSDPAFWKWQFLDNPHVKSDDIPTWIVTTEDKIVGQLAALPIELKVGGDIVRAIWVINMIVFPQYRGQRLGKRLFEFARDTYCSTMIALGINDQSGGVLRSLEWVWLDSINRYQILLFPGEAVKEISEIAPARHLINLLYTPFRPRASKLSVAGGGEIRHVSQFDSSFDDLWPDASVQWTCAVARTAKALEWQYLKQPGKKFEIIGYYEHDRLMGYAVLFIRRAHGGGSPPKAAITDLCYAANGSERVVDSLLKGALRLALEKRVGGLVTDVVDPLVERRLRDFGFHTIKSSPKFAAQTREHGELIYRRENWFLTRGDSDVSIFEEPNT